MRRVECFGIVGKLSTPKGPQTFYDTGRAVSPVDVARASALRYAVFNTTGKMHEKAMERMGELVIEVAMKVNVYPVGQAGLMDDGDSHHRALV